MWAKNKKNGFTIVELLIVVVVIAILASITIVSYNGIQSKSRFAKTRSDIASLQKYIESYNVVNGSYPTTAGIWKYQRIDGNNFIPGLVPSIATSIPSVTNGSGANTTNNTYIYISNGADYKLHRLLQPTIPSDEWSQVPASMKDSTWTDRWGVWSPGGAGF